MKRANFGAMLALTAIACLVLPTTAWAERFLANLNGGEEVPAVSNTATGRFDFFFNTLTPTLPSQNLYTLSYTAGFVGAVTVAHIHIGQPGVLGGVSIFLCGPAGSPAGTPVCPAAPGSVSGQITAAKVVGPAGQGVAAGQFAEVIRMIRLGLAYVNVHTTAVGTGEIRGVMR